MQHIDFDRSTSRVETGAVRFGDDWPGVFIRGDDALGWASICRHLAKNGDDFQRERALSKLAELLATCAVKP